MTDLLRIGDRVFRPITADSEPRPETELETFRNRMIVKYGTHKAAAEAWGISRYKVSNAAIGRIKIPDVARKDLKL